MPDTFNVTAAYDKASYNTGDTMKVSISGDDVLTQSVTLSAGPLTLGIKAADGATETITVPATTVLGTTSTPESVVITSVTDSGTPPRTWTIDPSGLFATATA